MDKKKFLFRFFKKVAGKDVDILKKISKKEEFYLDHKLWEFKLPDLYIFLKENFDEFKEKSYQEFRKSLYSSAINNELLKYKTKVIVKENKKNVDLSTYALSWSQKEHK